MKRIAVSFNNNQHVLEVVPRDNATANVIDKALPLTGSVKRWGDELYWDIGIDAPSLGATMTVSCGDIAYWPEGKCLCVFYGRTPASTGDVPVPASPVVLLGTVSADFRFLGSVPEGATVKVE